MKIRNITIALAIAALSIAVSGCDGKVAINDWVGKVNPLLLKVRTQMSAVPYGTEQQQDFRNYFSEIETMAVRLTQDNTYTSAFNQAVAKMDMKDLCTKTLLGRSEWQVIMNNCTKNGFFLCSDEVKFYSDLVAGVRKQLTVELQTVFDQTPPCKAAL